MFRQKVISGPKLLLLAGALVGSLFISRAQSQSAAPAAKVSASAPIRYVPPFPRRASMYYDSVWGVDTLKVKLAESGELVRFTYRVLDPQKATPLNDKKVEPSLFDPQAGVSLVIPQLENVGMLRQSSTPQAGKSYWMAFSNSGRHVKRGDQVIIVIGNFRAQGLVVE
jgi:hypothetical protein